MIINYKLVYNTKITFYVGCLEHITSILNSTDQISQISCRTNDIIYDIEVKKKIILSSSLHIPSNHSPSPFFLLHSFREHNTKKYTHEIREMFSRQQQYHECPNIYIAQMFNREWKISRHIPTTGTLNPKIRGR